MARELKIELLQKTADQIHVFKVSGSLGVEGSTGVQGLLEACLRQGVHRIVLDLEDVSFISSAGMGAFLSAVGELRKNGGDMILVRLQDRIRNVFRNLDVIDYFALADDLEDAVARFRGGDLPRPPSLKELTTRGTPAVEAGGTARALFSLLAAYADILDENAELSHKFTQLVDVTANYLALDQCALVPLDDDLELAPCAARAGVPPPPPAVRKSLAAALAGKDLLAVDQIRGLKKDLAAWLGAARVRFLFPLMVEGLPAAVLTVSDKKDGVPPTADERRVLRYLRTALALVLTAHVRAPGGPPVPEAQRRFERKLMELETVFTVSQELAEAMDVHRMLPIFLMMTTGQFGTDRAVILMEAAPRRYEVAAARGVAEAKWAELTLSSPAVSERLREVEGPLPASVLSLMLEERDRPELAPCSDAGLAVFAPLRFKDHLVGAVALGQKISGRDYEREELRLLGALVNLAAVHIETGRLVDKFKTTYSGVIRALVTAVEAKDKYTRGHTERVTRYAATLGVELRLDEATQQNLLFGAVLHDIGYIGVPEEILRMPNGITPEQLAELRRHPAIGANILKDLPILGEALQAVRHHHEHYDGSGYPDGLAGDAIPLIARVIAVADAYDAMTSERRYRAAKTREEVAAEIRKNRGAQFDPRIADAFLRLLESGRLDVIKSKT